MERSLTVLLPVRDAQATLAASVQQILEVLSDLTGRFEVVVVDDGSADATSEVLQELTRLYPQIRAVGHGRPLGREAAVRTGLQHSSGEIVFLRNGACGSGIEEIRRLWQEAEQRELDPTWAPPGGGRRPRWGSCRAGHQAGYEVIDRRSSEAPRARGKPARPNYLARLKDLALGE